MRVRILIKVVLIAMMVGLCVGMPDGSTLYARELETQNAPPVIDLPAEQVPPAPALRPTFSLPVVIDGAPVVTRASAEAGVATTDPGNLQVVTNAGPIVIGPDEKWIEVDLGRQRTIAYEGEKRVREFIISSGLPETPTVTGVFRMWVRTPSQTMYGGSAEYGSYYLENVQWVQYFYEDYSFHGTYWHDKFGEPMSHGCVNMTNEDAEWLFKWAMPEWNGEEGWLHSTGVNNTLVVVHE